jgi:O-antigen/teichoic acid export membrane protein
MAQTLATSVLTLLLAYLGFSYWSLAYGQIVPLFIFAIVLIGHSKWKPGISFNIELLKPVFHFGWWSFLKSQSNFITSHFEKILVGRMLGSHSLGIYDKSKSIALVPSESLLMNINSVMFSSFSQNKNEKTILKAHLEKSLFLTCFLSVPIHVGLIVVAPYFVIVLLGDKWLEMIIPFQFVLIGFIFKSFTGILVSFNVGVGKYKVQSLLTIANGVILIVICLILAKHGLVGISIAFMLHCIIAFASYLYVSFSTINLGVASLFKVLFTGVWSSTVMFGTIKYLSESFFAIQNMNSLFILILIGMATYLLCILLDKTKLSMELKHKIFSDLKFIIRKRA